MDILSIFTDLGSSFGTISGFMNWVFDVKCGLDFCRYRNSIQVIYFQISETEQYSRHPETKFLPNFNVK